MNDDLDRNSELAAQIGAKVRDLRGARRLTQAQLASELQVAQSRLSDLERGKASFTAEQFLHILRFFNVPASEFMSSAGGAQAELQNALARLGARHLVEVDDVLPSERLREVQAVVREVLVDASSPRFITGLAPLLVEQADAVNLPKVALELSQVGLDHRLLWLAANVLDAVRRELKESPRSPQARKLRRVEVVLSDFLSASTSVKGKPGALDVLDKSVRSEQTLRELVAEGSTHSKRWGIVTALQVEDFYHALEQAHGSV